MARESSFWRPLRDLVPRDFDRMKREMDRLWDSFLDRPRRGGEERADWLPALDVSETDNEIVVKAEIPGIDPNDIDVSLSGGVLTIKGQRHQEKEEKEENFHVLERNYGFFSRSIDLPKEVQNENIQATYKNGILKITLQKSEQSKRKEIKINVQ